MFAPPRPLIFLAFLATFLLSFASALPVVSPVTRDVWAPPITSPTSTTVWTVGGNYTVTWDASHPPSQITNPEGKVYLRKGNATQANPIAQGFQLSAGQVSVTVPSGTEPGDDWRVVLFGDSGNWSPVFTIIAAASS
ncbi:hypothetical protein F5I97DRAFT_1804350 [Phlebopus sp. FC_14]|nr:hypothetical protein F5I97DRAFT_1804350 [Phlebopus sp. FC_14]